MKKHAGKTCFLLAFIFVLISAVPVFAAGYGAGGRSSVRGPYGASLSTSADFDKIYDQAGLFTASEKKALSDSAVRLASKMNMDVVIVTTSQNSGSAEDYAEWFYYDNGLGTGSNEDGVLLLFDMANRELYVMTAGRMIRYLTDSRIDTILDDAYEYASGGDYYNTAKSFLADVETCYDYGIGSGQYNEDSATGKVSRYHTISPVFVILGAAVAAVCGIAAVRSVTREYGMKDDISNLTANFQMSYKKDSAFKLGAAGIADIALGTYVTQNVLAAAARTMGRGGMGGTGRSGGGLANGGGRSTTHAGPGRGGPGTGGARGGGGRRF